MASSSPRWRLACDVCDAGAWLGPSDPGFDAWCEACQTAQHLVGPPAPGERCVRCSAPLAATPRFVELWGSLQHLDAVLAAWAGDVEPLAALLPERPRFVTDLDPPVPRPDDPPARATLLALLARGDWRRVLAAPADPDPRAHAARAIAHERTGDDAAAIGEWNTVLAASEDARARLARGSLLARSGAWDAAARDLALAGTSDAARWDRAALLVHQAVHASEGLPDPGRIAAARAEAGPASEYWSDPTVGRLLWSLLVERALARGTPDPPDLPEESVQTALAAAEAELEHDTFWDRGMRIVGWSRLMAAERSAKIAGPLARLLAAALLDEPALAGAPLAQVTLAVGAARAAMDQGDPVAARQEIAGAFARSDLRRFRIPCAACGRGAVGIEETAERAPSGV